MDAFSSLPPVLSSRRTGTPSQGAPGRETGTGTFCAKHRAPCAAWSGRSGKRCLSPFPKAKFPALASPKTSIYNCLMAAFEDSSFSLKGFCGTVRLFPLPNLVLFPHVLQPLHIFEPRYREMLEDALAHDGLIALAMLEPGWEKDYDGRPPLYPMACLGQVTSHHRLKDGSYNVLLLGLHRVRLRKELAPRKSFREAKVELCEDCYPPEDALARPALQERLRGALVRVLPLLPQAEEQLDQLLSSDVPLGTLADIVSYMVDIDAGAKEALLEELNVHRRVELLLEHLAAVSAAGSASLPGDPFPPLFSPN